MSPGAQRLVRLLGAGGRVIKAAVNREPITVVDEEKERRLSICRGCEFFKLSTLNSHLSTCLKCGCALNLKTRLETEHCPIGKW
jgi:hypothetical protein